MHTDKYNGIPSEKWSEKFKASYYIVFKFTPFATRLNDLSAC